MKSVAAKLKPWLEAGLAFVYPEVCQLCGERRARAKEGLVCESCWSQVRFIRPPFCDRCGLPFEGEISTRFECTNCRELELHFGSARSAVVAKGVVLEAIHRYKYQGAVWYEPFLADLFLREALPALRAGEWDCVVPVPLFPARHREREFNQAERFGGALAKPLHLPLQTRWIRRVEPTLTQTRLTRQQRAANVQRAFVLHDRAHVAGQRIILVDDVFTTGATTNACARVLKAGGAVAVCVWTVARGL